MKIRDPKLAEFPDEADSLGETKSIFHQKILMLHRRGKILAIDSQIRNTRDTIFRFATQIFSQYRIRNPGFSPDQ